MVYHVACKNNSISEIVQLCLESPIGKKLPTAFYIHVSALGALHPQLQDYEQKARQIAPDIGNANVIKFILDEPKISYLSYPNFDIDPHPALRASLQVNLKTQEVSYRNYSNSENPPILHRKETFVTPDYPHYEKFAHLTQQEEKIGLLEKRKGVAIGSLQSWLDCLAELDVDIIDHQVISRSIQEFTPKIERHKAAMFRTELSRPMKLAIEAGFLAEGTRIFDYGCGRGKDLEWLQEQGYSCQGWDPYYRSETAFTAAEVVNLGYVINVIESQKERREALIKAWELTERVLIVSAQILVRDRNNNHIPYGDGVVTRRNTFQKYYEQEELKLYIDQVLGVDSVPMDLGVYAVFRDSAQAETFRASRFHSRVRTPRVRKPSKKFEDYQEQLQPLMEFVTERGRLPIKGELPQEAEVLTGLGTFYQAFKLILQATNAEEWDAITDKRRNDLLVYLALSHFKHIPQPRELEPVIRTDFKRLFGTYRSAQILAEQMLFSIGDLGFIAKCCHHAPIGKKTETAFSIHANYLDTLDPRLRLYEGCANRTIGRLTDATVIKFHLDQPKISYQFYPDFDLDPHPVLALSMQISLQDLQVRYKDFTHHHNPPILHEKHLLVAPDYPDYEVFAALSHQERLLGLLEDEKLIRTHQGWLKALREHCVRIEDYSIVWQEDADPQKLALAQAALHQRQSQEIPDSRPPTAEINPMPNSLESGLAEGEDVPASLDSESGDAIAPSTQSD